MGCGASNSASEDVVYKQRLKGSKQSSKPQKNFLKKFKNERVRTDTNQFINQLKAQLRYSQSENVKLNLKFFRFA